MLGCTFIYLMCMLNCIGPLGLIKATKRLSRNQCLEYRQMYDREKAKEEIKLQIELEKLKLQNKGE